MTSTSKRPDSSHGPKKQTLDFIRQFARIYIPEAGMPGLVVN